MKLGKLILLDYLEKLIKDGILVIQELNPDYGQFAIEDNTIVVTHIPGDGLNMLSVYVNANGLETRIGEITLPEWKNVISTLSEVVKQPTLNNDPTAIRDEINILLTKRIAVVIDQLKQQSPQIHERGMGTFDVRIDNAGQTYLLHVDFVDHSSLKTSYAWRLCRLTSSGANATKTYVFLTELTYSIFMAILDPMCEWVLDTK